MLTVKNEVHDRLIAMLQGNADAPYHGEEFYFSSTNQNVPKVLPCLNCVSLGEPQTGNDLEQKTQNFIISTIELKSYDKASYSNAFKVMCLAGDVMIDMGYELISGIEEISDSNKIAVARFRRLVGSGDKLY